MKKLLLALTITAASFTANAEWQYKKDVDIMTDQDKSLIGAISGRSTVMVQCNDSKKVGYDVIITFRYIGSEAKTINVRFDKNKPFEVYGNISTNGAAIFIQDSYKQQLIEGMKKGQSIAVKTYDFRGSPLVSQFSLTGFSKALSKLNCIN